MKAPAPQPGSLSFSGGEGWGEEAVVSLVAAPTDSLQYRDCVGFLLRRQLNKWLGRNLLAHWLFKEL